MHRKEVIMSALALRRLLLILVLVLLPILLFAPNASATNELQAGSTTTTNTNLHYNSNTNTENIAIGNTNTNNYNFQQSSYLPTQLTQVVLNVPKPKKLRISRPPTEEEFAIKRKLLNVYDEARRDTNGQSINFDHLGRILQALNPKYIATERVRRVAFGDPTDPSTLLPIPDVQPQPLSTISLKAEDGSLKGVTEQLDLLAQHFRSQVNWELQFAELLANTDDAQLNPNQLAFKRLLLCLTQPAFCPKPDTSSYIIQQAPQQAAVDMMERPEAVSASQSNPVYLPPPPPQQQQQQQNQLYQQQQHQHLQETDRKPRSLQRQMQINRPVYYLPDQQPYGTQTSTPANRNQLRFRTRYSPPKWIYRGPQSNNHQQ